MECFGTSLLFPGRILGPCPSPWGGGCGRGTSSASDWKGCSTRAGGRSRHPCSLPTPNTGVQDGGGVACIPTWVLRGRLDPRWPRCSGGALTWAPVPVDCCLPAWGSRCPGKADGRPVTPPWPHPLQPSAGPRVSGRNKTRSGLLPRPWPVVSTDPQDLCWGCVFLETGNWGCGHTSTGSRPHRGQGRDVGPQGNSPPYPMPVAPRAGGNPPCQSREGKEGPEYLSTWVGLRWGRGVHGGGLGECGGRAEVGDTEGAWWAPCHLPAYACRPGFPPHTSVGTPQRCPRPTWVVEGPWILPYLSVLCAGPSPAFSLPVLPGP